MLFELAVGDAYGASFEFTPAAFVEEHNLVEYYPEHPTHAGLRPGDYTDDTQLSIALCELLLAGSAWSPVAVASSLLGAFRRDPRVGYSRRMQRLLSNTTSGAQLIAECPPGNTGSGAAMRSAPLGALPDVDTVLAYARIQAEVTHDTLEGVAAAQAVALAAHVVWHQPAEPLTGLGICVSEILAATGCTVDFSAPWHGSVGADGSTSVRAALTALGRASSMTELLRDCISYTGDVDTVAAIALAIAARSERIRQDLPRSLVLGLENGTYGRDYLIGLDERLCQTFDQP